MKKFEQKTSPVPERSDRVGVEKLEREPKISYHVFYSPHWTAMDIEKLEGAFKKADIYVPEGTGVSPELIDIFDKLSQGEITADQLAASYSLKKNSPHYKRFQIIEGSMKPILFVDLPGGHELSKAETRVDDLCGKSFEFFLAGDFKAALKTMHEHIMADVDYETKREEIIKANLKERSKELTKTYPKLRDKKEIKVLLDLGRAHTKFWHDLKKEGLPISKQFAYQPAVFSSLSEAARKAMFSKKKEIPEELLARGIIEELLNNYFEAITDNTNKIIMVERKISSKLSLKDIAKISQQLNKDPRGLGLIDILEERGIKLPKTEKEMDKMLKNKKSLK